MPLFRPPHTVHLLSPLYILSTPSSLTSLLLSLCWSLLVVLLYRTAILPVEGPCWQQKAAERTLGGLASVTGLLLAFRSNSATSRWDGASRCWASIQAAERSLLRLLGVGLYHDLQTGQQQVTVEDGIEDGGEGAEDEEETAQLEAYIDDFLRLLPSFALAVLVQLEAGPLGGRRSKGSSRPPAWLPSPRDTPDVQASKQALRSLLPPRLARSLEFCSSSSTRPSKKRQSSSFSSLSTRTTSSATVKNEADREVKLSQNIDPTPDLLLRAQPYLDPLTDHIVPRNLPVDILRELQVGLVQFHQGVSARRRRRGGGGHHHHHHREIKLSGPLYAHSIGLLNTLTSQLTELERLRDTPIPALLSSHLHLLLNLQLALTPLALARAYVPLGWVWLPCAVMTMGSCGLHAVSEGLSLPFGVGGREKLPMRRLVGEVVGEWREVLGRVREMSGVGDEASGDEDEDEDGDGKGACEKEALLKGVAASKGATTSSSRPLQQPPDSLRHRRRRSPRGHDHGHDTHAGSSSSKERRYPRPRVVVEEDGDLDLHGLADELADVDALAAADRIAAAYAGGGD